MISWPLAPMLFRIYRWPTVLKHSEFWDHFSGSFFSKISVSHILDVLLLLETKICLPHNNISNSRFLLSSRPLCLFLRFRGKIPNIQSSITLAPCNLFIFSSQSCCFKFQLLVLSDSEYQMFLALLQFYGCAFLIYVTQW